MPIALHVVFRAAGIKWPLRDDDKIEVWGARTNELLFVITGELLKTLLRHHLDALAVQSMMARELERLEPPKRGDEPMPAENPVDKDKRQTLRDQRRKPPRKMMALALAFLFGCASPVMVKPGVTELERRRDYYECDRDRAMVGAYQEWWVACMRARGYEAK